MQIPLSELVESKKVYFASDFHLGVPNPEESLNREKKIVRWLAEVANDAEIIILLGDVFDFWFEYKHAIPKGHVRLLGKIAELTDQGIEVYLFSGNHDLWLNDYLIKEIGVKIFHAPQSFQIGSKSFYLAHGDGLGPGDKKYKFFKKIFTNSFCQWLFKWLHPDIGIAMAKFWSKDSRISQQGDQLEFLGDEEWLVIHSRSIEAKTHHDYYIFGHRHIPGTYRLTEDSTYVNLGEWIKGNSFAKFDGDQLTLENFK